MTSPLLLLCAGDYKAYESMTAQSVTCIEPETKGNVVEGTAFHKFFFPPAPQSPTAKNTTMAAPHVRLMGDSSAVVTYVRLVQSANGISSSQETRVWQNIGGNWLNVHFHRSSAL